jgi:diguanylate cyclase (GGDEF)-like protein
MLSKGAETNRTEAALTSYEYLTTLTKILINTDGASEENLLEQLDVSNKLADQMIALNLRDKGLQISAYSQQLYSDWKVLKSARDFENSTDAKFTNIIDGININAKAAADNISKNLKEKENTTSTFIITLFISSTIVFFLLAYISTKRTSYRFKMLISATKQIADGDFSVNFIPKDGDEIDLLGKHIYHMSENLKGYEKSLLETNANLEKANTHLEESVLERTRQLEEARDKLLIVNEELELDKKRFQLLATTDSLTGVRNRGAIMNLIDDEIKRFPNYNKPFCIVLFDIDDFKKVNDKYGHTVGDEVLIEITKLVQAAIGDTDCIGRYGGEEFLIFLPNTPLETAKIVVENILLKLRATPLSSKLLPIRISGGLIEYKSGIIDEVLQIVDDLLYKSKHNGKDQFNW